MPKVFIPNKGGYDYTAAARYGGLVYCTNGPLKKHDISHMVRLMTAALEGSDPDDYIIITGLSSLCSIACAIFAAKHGRLNLLIYHEGSYHEHHIPIGDNIENLESVGNK